MQRFTVSKVTFGNVDVNRSETSGVSNGRSQEVKFGLIRIRSAKVTFSRGRKGGSSGIVRLTGFRHCSPGGGSGNIAECDFADGREQLVFNIDRSQRRGGGGLR